MFDYSQRVDWAGESELLYTACCAEKLNGGASCQLSLSKSVCVMFPFGRVPFYVCGEWQSFSSTLLGSKDHKRTFGSTAHAQSSLRDSRLKNTESSPDWKSIRHINAPPVRQPGELYIETPPNITCRQRHLSLSLSPPSDVPHWIIDRTSTKTALRPIKHLSCAAWKEYKQSGMWNRFWCL